MKGASPTSLVGALAGTGGYTTFNNDYWNGDLNPMPTGSGLRQPGQLEGGSQGLHGAQFADVAHYADHSIGQVLSDRAEAATEQAAFESAGRNQAERATGEALRQQEQQQINQVRAASTIEPPASINDFIVFTDSDSYSANIKHIKVNGVDYEMEEEKTKK